ncbi:MAG: hypothetical protein AAGJ34_05310 [Pseudomonadota bacterium]
MDRMIRMLMNQVMRHGVNAAIDWFADRRKTHLPSDEHEEVDANRTKNKKNMKRANQAMRMVKRVKRF